MKYVIYFFTFTFFCSCNNKKIIVTATFADSIISNYTPPASSKLNEEELIFWKGRINPDHPGMVNEMKYASSLISRFRMYGDIHDVKSADSVLLKVDSLYNQKEASPNLSLVSHYILQHRFQEANNYFQKAKAIGLKKYESACTEFDINFELGNYANAFINLNGIKVENDYGYQFRLAKWEHYRGNLENSIKAMQKALDLSGNNIDLKQAALSNLADLYLHNCELEKAYDLYVQSIKLNTSDFHSLMGVGWIALVHDNNDSLAEKIFQFVHLKTKAPDPLYKLIYVAQQIKDTMLEKKLAKEYIDIVSDSIYGNMYNKYLIELYTDVLHEPAIAEVLAKKELLNRATPQTYTWYAYALFVNNKPDEAYKIYQQFVSGKPLEGLELYWMGKMMQGLNKGYNANAFFKQAYNNRYDLSPEKIENLEKELNKK